MCGFCLTEVQERFPVRLAGGFFRGGGTENGQGMSGSDEGGKSSGKDTFSRDRVFAPSFRLNSLKVAKANMTSKL